ncbi:MAG: sensor histidine kinase [Chitinispirillaceae bacterium]|jgi:signal transduction histidine kinase|nr:sensor histidine kinase [Chitinispirillaceae bacterium]
MIFVFFIYGLSFFSLGLAILLISRKGSDLQFGRHLYLLAIFGLLHSVNEWMDMFLLLGRGYWSPAAISTLEVIRFFFGEISYLFLFIFGLRLIMIYKTKTVVLLHPAWALYTVFIAGQLVYGMRAGFSDSWFHFCDALARYFLAFPAALLAATAMRFLSRDPEIQNLHGKKAVTFFSWLSLSFAAYALFAGLIVKGAPFFPASIVTSAFFMEHAGFPVQICRAACAIIIAAGMTKLSRIFELEREKKLEDAGRAVVSISENEKRKIGQEIHDGLSQQLAGIGYLCKAQEQKAGRGDVLDKNELAFITHMVEEAIGQTRSIAKGLFPVHVDKLGLSLALSELADQTRKISQAECVLDLDPALPEFDIDTASHLFRIVQESLANAVKHGKANRVDVGLRKSAPEIILSVEDNGTGIEPSRRTNGLGIRIMQYRATMLGGRLAVDRKETGGTIVTCILPGDRNKG